MEQARWPGRSVYEGISNDQHVIPGCAFGFFASPALWVWLRPALYGRESVMKRMRRRLENRQGQQHDQRHDVAGIS